MAITTSVTGDDRTESGGTGSKRGAGWAATALLLGCAALTGCQIDVAGQTLPSPSYLQDDVQYYAPGPEFKLAREAAALKAQSEAYESEHQNCCP